MITCTSPAGYGGSINLPAKCAMVSELFPPEKAGHSRGRKHLCFQVGGGRRGSLHAGTHILCHTLTVQGHLLCWEAHYQILKCPPFPLPSPARSHNGLHSQALPSDMSGREENQLDASLLRARVTLSLPLFHYSLDAQRKLSSWLLQPVLRERNISGCFEFWLHCLLLRAHPGHRAAAARGRGILSLSLCRMTGTSNQKILKQKNSRDSALHDHT